MGKMTYKQLALVWIIFIQLITWQSSFAQNCPIDLVNRVVYEGTVDVLEPRDNSEPVVWQVVPSSDAFSSLYDITTSGDTVNSGFEVAYGANSTGLIIKNATIYPVNTSPDPISTAGFYILNYQTSGCQTAAKLVVTRNQMCSCQPDTSSAALAQLICSIEFADIIGLYDIYPFMTWKNSSNDTVKTDIPFPSLVDEYTYKSTSSLTIDSASASTYRCQVKFTAPNDSRLPYAATNAPDFSTSCDIANCVSGAK